MELSKKEIQEIADAAAEKAIKRTLHDIGLRPDEPFEMRRDLEFLNSWRQLCEMSKTRAMGTLVFLMVSGIATVLIIGFKGWFK